MAMTKKHYKAFAEITPIQFADENAVVMFLASLHEACISGLVEGF